MLYTYTKKIQFFQLLLLINTLSKLQITGLALIITGCVIQGVYSNYLDFLGDSFFNTPVLLVVVGCIIFFVTFFGCCGAIKEHHCMTLAFSVFLSLILLIELGAGIASYTFRQQVIHLFFIYNYIQYFWITFS